MVKIIVVYFLSLLSSGINIIQPLLYMVIIDSISKGKTISISTYLILVYALLTAFQKTVNYIEDLLSTYCKHFILLEIKSELLDHIQKLPLGYFSKETPAKLINRITNDVNAFAIFIDGSLKNIINNIFSLIGILTITKFMGTEYIIIAIISTSFSYIVTILFSQKQKMLEKEQSDSRGNIYNSISETLSAIDLVKVSTTRNQENKKFYDLSVHQIYLLIKSQNLSYLRTAFGELIDIIVLSTVFIYGGMNIIKGSMTIGGILAIYQYVTQLRKSLGAFASQYVGLKLALGIIERVIDVFHHDTEDNNDETKLIIKSQLKGSIRFENVSFGYSRQSKILENVNFIINEGETVLFFGPSGIGKTTITKLLLRYIKPINGSIFVDNYRINEVNLDYYRKQFGVVLQEIRLFSTSIKENICYGYSKVTESEIINAAQIAQIHNDIISLDKGYDTLISANQTELSVGQKQRITLARAIIKNPPILILDEATVAIDSTTDILIMEALGGVFKNRTSLIISHKHIPLKIFNRVFLLKNNSVIEITKEEYSKFFKV